MDRERWRALLERLSGDLIRWDAQNPEPVLDGDAVRAGWLGYGPATPERIEAAQARLGCRFPPSLREFFLLTDGWRFVGHPIYGLRATSELGWLRDLEPFWLPETEDADDESAVLGRSLQVSLDGDLTVAFLDPGDVRDDGEWACYRLSSWSGTGPEYHGSFYGLVLDLAERRRPDGEV